LGPFTILSENGNEITVIATTKVARLRNLLLTRYFNNSLLPTFGYCCCCCCCISFWNLNKSSV